MVNQNRGQAAIDIVIDGSESTVQTLLRVSFVTKKSTLQRNAIPIQILLTLNGRRS